jgi:hypothetical protein
MIFTNSGNGIELANFLYVYRVPSEKNIFLADKSILTARFLYSIAALLINGYKNDS